MADARERVLITGASSGIGLATAEAFGRRKARVALLARRREGLTLAAKAVSDAGGQPLTAAVDVADREQTVRGVTAAVEQMGGLDVAVVGAGAASYGLFTETSEEDFDETLAVTLAGAIDTIRICLPALEDSGGTLVVIGSVASKVPLPLLAGYSAAKSGLEGFVAALRVELRSAGSAVSLSVVRPGPVDTPFWENVAAQEGRLPPDIPLVYEAGDVAAAIVGCVGREGKIVTVGGAMVLIEGVHALARSLSEAALSLIARTARSSGSPGPGKRAIAEPSGAGRTSAGLLSRPSVAVIIGSGLRSIRRMAGR
jgi:short-subunit dehydrogenase